MEQKYTPKTGYLFSITAQVLYAAFVFYWKLIKAVPAYETLAIRVTMSCITGAVILLCIRQLKVSAILLKDRHVAITITLAGAFLCLNWGTYIYGVGHNAVIECSIGYFLSPLVTALFGILFFKEAAGRHTLWALIFAAVGVVILTVYYGKIPYISIILSFSYSVYLTLKKRVSLPAVGGLFLESFVMMPIALIYLISLAVNGKLVLLSTSAFTFVMVMLVGVVTIIPLFLLMVAQKSISLTAVGIISNITPLLSTLIGVLVYHEVFTRFHAVALSLILLALAVFTVGQVKTRSGAVSTDSM